MDKQEVGQLEASGMLFPVRSDGVSFHRFYCALLTFHDDTILRSTCLISPPGSIPPLEPCGERFILPTVKPTRYGGKSLFCCIAH
jgi:hypothetical protein